MILPSERRVFYLAVFIILLSFAQLFYRLSLPTDGWSFARDTTGSGMLLVFDHSLSGQPSLLQHGDVLLGVEGQPVSDLLSGALTLNPRRPPNWAAGQTVQYRVMRAGHVLHLDVRLARLPLGSTLLNAGRNLLMDPGPLLMVLIAFFVFFREPRSRPAQLLMLFSAAVFASDGVSQVVSGSNVLGLAEMFYPGAYGPALLMNSIIWPLLIAPLFLHLLLSFPAIRVGLRLRQHGWRRWALIYGLGPALTLLLWLADATPAVVKQPLAFWQAWNTFSFYDFVLVLLAAIAIMAVTLVTARDASGRAQATWIAWGTILTSLGALSGSAVIILELPSFGFALAWTATRLLMLGFPIAVSIAILRYRLFDIDIIIHNTVVYGVLTGLLSAIYLVSVILLQYIFRAFTGERSPVAIVLSTLAIAALFVPLRRQVQQVIDRRMYHHKYDIERIVSTFGATLRNEVDLERLSQRLVQVAEETMQAKEASLWLRRK